jgi:glutamyl/glutaminyl-tRNA synthetase
VGMAKLDFLSPKHAVARVEAGGSAYEDMLDLVVVHVRALCNNNVDNLVPAMLQDEETQRKYVDVILRLDAKNYKNAADYVATHAYFFLNRSKSAISIRRRPQSIDANTGWDEQEHQLKDKLIECLAPLTSASAEWTHDTINKAIAEVQDSLTAEPLAPLSEKIGARFVQNWVWEYVRAYVCFGERGPSVADAMEILGSDVVLDRIKNIEVVRIRRTPLEVKASNEEKFVVESAKVKVI